MTVELRTRYLGLELRSPIVASAAPNNGEPAVASASTPRVSGRSSCHRCSKRRSAEEIELNRSLEQGTEHFAEALNYFPAVETFVRNGRSLSLARLERVKTEVGVPVIASLNASTVGGWVHHARRIEEGGRRRARAEPHHVAANSNRTAADAEAADLELIAAVRATVTIPLAVKLNPYYSAFANFAAAVIAAGADGLVLFNRFYQPDLDLDSLDVVPRLEVEPRDGTAAAGPLDRDPAPAARLRGIAGGHFRRPFRDRCDQGPHGRRRRRDDDVSAAPERSRARRYRWKPSCGPGWPSASTSRSTSCGQRERRDGRRSRCLPAGQLHGDPSILGDAPRADVGHSGGGDASGRSRPEPTRQNDLVRTVSAEEAVDSITSGDQVYLHCAAATPSVLLDALVDRAPELHDVGVVHLHRGPGPHLAPEMAGHFRHRALFIGPNARAAVNEGRADYVPVFLSDVPRLFNSGALPLDAVLVNATPPDAHGFCSLGVSVEAMHAAIRAAGTVIVQLNRAIPRTLGESFIHVDDIDLAVEVDAPPYEYGIPEPGDVEASYRRVRRRPRAGRRHRPARDRRDPCRRGQRPP